MSDKTDLKRKKLRTAMFLLITVIALYIGVFFFKDV
jgi:hypothetical protein